MKIARKNQYYDYSEVIEIDFRPVVQVPGTRMHHKAALETGGNATATAEGDKQQADFQIHYPDKCL